MTDIYPYNTSSVRPRRGGIYEADLNMLLTSHFGSDVITISSARVGLYLIQKSLGFSRMDHILIPDFFCREVLYILNLHGFGVQEPNARTKAVVVLHQWGYPQRMDVVMNEAKKRKWVVIEDCVHTFGSTYRGKIVGSFGDAAIISFPKFFPTYVGGAIVSRRDDIISYARVTLSKPHSAEHHSFDHMSVQVGKSYYLLRKLPFVAPAVYIQSIHFPKIPTAALQRFPGTLETFRLELAQRKNNFITLKQAAGAKYHPKQLDEDCDVVPMCVPMFFPEEKLIRVQRMLKEKNIVAEILHFDVNRNMLHPRYKKCLALPCHQYITEKELSHMCDVIRRVGY